MRIHPVQRTATAATIALLALAIAAPTAAAHAAEESGHWQLEKSLPFDAASYLTISPASGTLFVSTFDPNDPPAQVRALDIATDEVRSSHPAGIAPQPSASSVDAATNRMYVPSYGSGELLTLDATTGEQLASLSGPTWMPWGTAVDPTTNTVYLTDGNDNNQNPSGFVTVVDGATNTIVTTIPSDNSLAYPVVSTKQQKLYVPVSGLGYVLVIDTVTNTIVDSIYPDDPTHMQSPTALALDDELNRLFVLNVQSNDVAVIDTETDEVVVESIPLPEHYLANDRISINPVTHQVFVTGFFSDGNGASDEPTKIFTIDALSSRIVSTTDAPAGSIFDTAIDPRTNVLYAVHLDTEGTTLVLKYRWIEPALARTGSEATPAAAAIAVLLIGGVLLVAIGRRRARV